MMPIPMLIPMNEHLRRYPLIAAIPLICLWGLFAPAAGAADELLQLRREYNQVAASIDTLARLHGGDHLENLAARSRPGEGVVPAGFDLVLIFWADDEARVYLNGFHVGSTRLTPILVEIPTIYLREVNRVRAHCWDTDRVESGFMAGFYLRDHSGLRPVLTTRRDGWWTAGQPASEIYYAHSLPDIPGARVIWGAHLFGSVELEAQFSGSAVTRAARTAPVQPPARMEQQRMQGHDVVSRLVQLQERRRQLAAALARWQHQQPGVRYEGRMRGRLAFSLGEAGPLAEEHSMALAENLESWAQELPSKQQQLLFREPRELKGVEVATPAEDIRPPEAEGEEDRRTDYQPPPERGPVREGVTVWELVVTELQRPVAHRRQNWGLIAAATGLGIYVLVIGWGWRREFNHEVWKT